MLGARILENFLPKIGKFAKSNAIDDAKSEILFRPSKVSVSVSSPGRWYCSWLPVNFLFVAETIVLFLAVAVFSGREYCGHDDENTIYRN